MVAFATLTLTDRVPANIVFTPSRIDSSGVATYYSTATVMDGRPAASISVRLPAKGGSVARVIGKVVVPIMDSVDTSLKIGESIGTFELVLPKVATENQRLDIRALLKSLLDNAVTTGAVQNLESVY